MSFLDTLEVEPLPPALEAGGFDCEEDELTAYLTDGTAARDQASSVARTYLVRSQGELVAYFNVLADAIRLETKEKPDGIVYSSVPALKLGRMGVERGFKKRGVGHWILDYVVGMARATSVSVGIRYVTLDALKKDRLVHWYSSYGFKENKGHAKLLAKILKLASKDDLSHVSMRYDILLEREVVEREHA